MPTSVVFNEKTLNSKEFNKDLHYIPAKFSGDGKGNVDTYFNNYTRTENGYFTNALRGYSLQGTKLTVPSGYRGIVLHANENVNGTLRVRGTFNSFNYWNYDRLPTKNDNYIEAMQIIPVASKMSKSITEDEVNTEMESHKYHTTKNLN